MADGRRISFEEDLAESVRSMGLMSPRREAELSPVNEEDAYEAGSEPSTSSNNITRSSSLNGSNNSRATRPFTQRRTTDPISPITTNLHLRPAASTGMGRSRTRSPYSRSHLRSKSNTTMSSSSSLSSSSHAMTRAYSSPLSDSVPELLPPLSASATQTSFSRPESPMGMGFGRRASPRRHLDEPFTYTPIDAGTPSVPTIEENVELSLPSPSHTIPEDGVPMPLSPFASFSSTFARPARRRPSSPLHAAAARTHSPSARILHTSSSVPTLSMNRSASNPTPAISTTGLPPMTPTSVTSPASRYNESYPLSPIAGGRSASNPIQPTNQSMPSGSWASSASSMYSLSVGSSSVYSAGGTSMPSTPTSMRSRSPSISSLDTIPDSPDAEAEAIEQDKQDREERMERMEKLRSIVGNPDSEELGRRMLGGGGPSVAAAKERKRWSVCGAERRGDLEMETIWED